MSPRSQRSSAPPGVVEFPEHADVGRDGPPEGSELPVHPVPEKWIAFPNGRELELEHRTGHRARAAGTVQPRPALGDVKSPPVPGRRGASALGMRGIVRVEG